MFAGISKNNIRFFAMFSPSENGVSSLEQEHRAAEAIITINANAVLITVFIVSLRLCKYCVYEVNDIVCLCLDIYIIPWKWLPLSVSSWTVMKPLRSPTDTLTFNVEVSTE